MTPGKFNFDIQRHAPFKESLRFKGYDFTGATFAMQFRKYRAAQGDPLIDLENASSGAQGLSVVVTEESGVTISTVTVQINKSTIDATEPWPANGQKAETDVELYYDLKITGGGIPETRWIEGTATIREGVTV